MITVLYTSSSKIFPVGHKVTLNPGTVVLLLVGLFDDITASSGNLDLIFLFLDSEMYIDVVHNY